MTMREGRRACVVFGAAMSLGVACAHPPTAPSAIAASPARSDGASVSAYDPNVDYRALLRTSPPYAPGSEGSARMPAWFRFQQPDALPLATLRRVYSLDEVAGQGSSFERAKRLSTWVHRHLRHEGEIAVMLPPVHDAASLMAQGTEGKTTNCRGFSITLVEACLAVGVPARFVVMLPRDPSTDSHVVAAVWAREYSKWVFVDPTFDAYFVGDDGVPLDFEEIRAALIAGSLPAARGSFDENGAPSHIDYRNYLAKNMYFFMSPAESSAGYDSSAGRSFLLLAPAGGRVRLPERPEKPRVTTDPTYFWAAPSEERE